MAKLQNGIETLNVRNYRRQTDRQQTDGIDLPTLLLYDRPSNTDRLTRTPYERSRQSAAYNGFICCMLLQMLVLHVMLAELHCLADVRAMSRPWSLVYQYYHPLIICSKCLLPARTQARTCWRHVANGKFNKQRHSDCSCILDASFQFVDI